jgi:serine/threonine-protein kinase
MFTLDYAAPEQIRGEAITTATDVYALGVVLYELLAGRRPYSLSSRSTTLEQAILDTAPPAPSTALAPGDASAAQRRRELRGDLDRIVLTALAKEPERRYPSAEALAADIRNYLDGRPVSARGDAAMYRLRKFIRRNRIGVVAATIVFAALIVAMGVSLWQARLAREQAQRAETKSRTAEAVKDYLLSVFSSANPYNTDGRLVSARDLLETGFAHVDEKLSGQPEVAAEIYAAFVETFFQLDQADLGNRAAEKAIAAYRQFLPADAIEILRIESSVAEIKLFRAQTDGLAEQLNGMLARIGDRDGDFAELRADVLTLLGLTYYELGAYDRAVDFGERAVAELQKVHGRVHYSVSVALYDIALARLKQGRIADAAALIDEFVAMDRSLVGPEHPGMMTDVITISMLLHDVGRLRETRELVSAAIASRLRQFGEPHRSVVNSRARLGAVLVDLGNAREAEDLLTGVIASAATASMATLDRSGIRFDHARALVDLNRLNEARAEFQTALDLVRAAAPADSPLALSIAAALADVERRRGDAAQALALLEPIVKRQRERDDRELPASLLIAARVNRATGSTDLAGKALTEAAALLDQQGRPTHALAREVELEQAALALASGDAKSASEHRLRAAAIGCINFGCDDARVKEWIRAAAAAQGGSGGSTEAIAASTAHTTQSALAVSKPYETQYATALDIITKANAALASPTAKSP